MFVALPLLATRLTDDPVLIAAAMGAQQVPWLLFGVFAGLQVDRRNPIRAMVLADAVRMAVMVAVAVGALLDRISIWQLIALAFALGIGDIVFVPASNAAVPAIVDRQSLPRANGLMSTAGTACEGGVGPIAGGVLYSVGTAVPFVANAASFGLSALLLRDIPLRQVWTEPDQAGATVREALSWYRSCRPLVLITMLAAAIAFGHSMVVAVLVLIGKDVLGLSDVGYGVFYTLSAAGNVVGGYLSDRVWARFGTHRTLLSGALLVSLGYAITGISGAVAVTVIALFIESLAIPVINVVNATLRQLLAPPGRRGQVTNVFRLFIMGAVPLGALAGGWVASVSNPRAAAGAAAILIALAAFGLMIPLLKEPTLRGSMDTTVGEQLSAGE